MNSDKDKIRIFLENFIFYAGMILIQKGLPFLTLPFLTRLIKDPKDYGITDMFNLLTSLGTALSCLGMYDAIFREFFEKKDDKRYQYKVTAIGLNIVIISSLLIIILIITFSKSLSIQFFENKNFQGLVILCAITILINSLNNILMLPTRINNNRKVLFIANLFFPIVGFLFTICLIKKGYTYEGLIYGAIGMNLLSVLSFLVINFKFFSIRVFEFKIAKELLKIGIPLVPGVVIYWLFSSADRIMINRLLGSNELGIYSVGAKIASISQVIYLAFSGGWSYFAFSTMKDRNQVETNSKIFEYLGLFVIYVYIFSQPFIKPIFNFFLTDQYVKGENVFSFLFLSPLVFMLYQIVGNQLIIIKKTYIPMVALSLGAITNIILNFILIKNYGIRGAAFSTFNGYFISLLVISIICLKYKLLIISKRFYICGTMIIIGLYVQFFYDDYICYKIIYFCIFLLISYTVIRDLKNILKRRQ